MKKNGMKNEKLVFPGTLEAEAEREAAAFRWAPDPEEPDFVDGLKPNYDKFKGWPVENVLSFLNID